MTSIKQYEASLAELRKIEKQYGTDAIHIRMNHLDGRTKEVIIDALCNAIDSRKNKIISTIEGGNKV